MIETSNIREKVFNDLHQTIDNLYSIVEKNTTNEVSYNKRFIVQNIEEDDIADVFKEKRRSELDSFSMCDIEELTDIIYSSYNDISWVDLTILHTNKKESIILATLVKVNKTDSFINYHCSLELPTDFREGVRFDLNKY